METQRRIELTRDMMERFHEEVFKGNASEFSSHKGLPYRLIYNLIHGRIHSLSASDYIRIFGEPPPEQETQRVNGEYFRGMVRLWLFLNDHATKKNLYAELFPRKKSVKRPDYRIFTGATSTVEKRLERVMERKFLDQGLGRAEIQAWVRELDQYHERERVSFHTVEPILSRLEKNLKVHPTRLLNRWITPYESGELKTISGELFEKLKALDRKAEEAVRNPSRAKFESLREEIYGSRKGLILFSQIEEELEFLKAWGGRSPKKYLGRSIGKYRRSKLKRVASWRAEEIVKACEVLVAEKPNIPVKVLPARLRIKHWKRLTAALEQTIAGRMFSKDKVSFEKQVLAPVYHTKSEYESDGYAFVSVRDAARTLKMSEKAFDLLMAAHPEIFKKIGRYEGKWLIPDRYLAEVSSGKEFPLLRAKYEWLAKKAVGRRFSGTGVSGRGQIHSPETKRGTPDPSKKRQPPPFTDVELSAEGSMN